MPALRRAVNIVCALVNDDVVDDDQRTIITGTPNHHYFYVLSIEPLNNTVFKLDCYIGRHIKYGDGNPLHGLCHVTHFKMFGPHHTFRIGEASW